MLADSLVEEATMGWLDRLLPVLRPLPNAVYAHLITAWQEPHERLQRWRCVLMREPGSTRTLVRVVDADRLGREHITVRGYGDLDGRTDLVLYEGWFSPGVGAELRRAPAAAGAPESGR